MQRQFTSGSRQAPDPFDQFLEENQYYRKHTARDASCLFRVISEQMYDTQLHHLVIREKCVTYMRKHRQHFDYHVDRDFDEYLDDMSKPKTYGTLLELQAASYMFERNVFLFQPFNLGNYFSEYRSNFVEVFRVFYTPERHFDSVFTSDYIQEAAICQSICYEILYKDLFKLPDVSFAVEQMLHGPTFENMDFRTETNEEGYPTCLYLSDGRSFELDLAHNTNCILENYKLCHFHYTNFPRYSDDLQRELKTGSCEERDKNSLIIQRTAESFLPNKYVSCVRQLLQEGITPFPYKVAKALDPNMYRNIEFDSWNEMRKELKLQNWYNGDANFKKENLKVDNFKSGPIKKTVENNCDYKWLGKEVEFVINLIKNQQIKRETVWKILLLLREASTMDAAATIKDYQSEHLAEAECEQSDHESHFSSCSSNQNSFLSVDNLAL